MVNRRMKSYTIAHLREGYFDVRYAMDLDHLRKNLMSDKRYQVKNFRVNKYMADGQDEPFVGDLTFNKSLGRYMWFSASGKKYLVNEKTGKIEEWRK